MNALPHAATFPGTARRTSIRLSPARRLSRVVAATTAVALLTTAGLLAQPAHAAPATPSTPSATPGTAKTASRPAGPTTNTVGVGVGVGVGSNPYDVAVSLSLGKAFVVNDGSVTVISLLTQRRLDDFGTGGYHGQSAITLVRGNTQGYITNYDKAEVTVFDTETHKVLRQIKVGPGPVDFAKVNTAKGQRAYVALQSTNRLAVIQTSTDKVVQHVKLPHGSQTLTPMPDGDRLWAGSSYDGHVYDVNTAIGKLSRTIDVGPVGPVTSVAFTPNTKRAWVAGLGGVAVVNVRTGKTVKFLPILKIFRGAHPNMGAVALTGSGRYAYVEDSTFPDTPARGTLSMIDTKTYRVVHRIRTGVQPENLVIDTRRDIAHAPNYGDDTLTYVDVPK